MIRILQAVHPGALIDNEIIEPNPQHVAAYKGKAIPACLGYSEDHQLER